MRIPLFLASALACTGTPTAQGAPTAPTAQGTPAETYWQRESGTRHYPELEPFRSPDKHTIDPKNKLLFDLISDLTRMLEIATTAKRERISFDKTGREIVDDKRWAELYERVKSNNLNQDGWLGRVLLEDGNALRRRVAAYGMFYFNNPQNVFHLIAYLPGEPEQKIREEGFQRALEFLAVHLPQSTARGAKQSGDGIVVPKFEFNPLPFMQILDQESHVDKAQGLWFLTEVLKIRPDLGKAYFDELRDAIPKLLRSDSKIVRTRAVDFLAAIDTKSGRSASASKNEEASLEWFRQLDYELFPPIRRVSSGVVDLYPSDDFDKLVAAGKRLLDGGMKQDTAKAKNGFVRYGVRVDDLPPPLEKLGIPVGALIVAVNAAPARSTAELRQRIKETLELAKADGELPEGARERSATAFQVEYIYRGKTQMMEIRLR